MVSKKTARNHVPAIYRLVLNKFGWACGSVNLDLGSGPYCKLSTTLRRNHAISSYNYDPEWFSDEFNDKMLYKVVQHGGADTVTISNVLNVLPTHRERADLLETAMLFGKPEGRIYITVHEGDKSGTLKKTLYGY